MYNFVWYLKQTEMNTQPVIADYRNQIATLENGVDYCNGMILNSQIQEWERKEYKEVLADNKAEIIRLNNLIDKINRLYPNG